MRKNSIKIIFQTYSIYGKKGNGNKGLGKEIKCLVCKLKSNVERAR